MVVWNGEKILQTIFLKIQEFKNKNGDTFFKLDRNTLEHDKYKIYNITHKKIDKLLKNIFNIHNLCFLMSYFLMSCFPLSCFLMSCFPCCGASRCRTSRCRCITIYIHIINIIMSKVFGRLICFRKIILFFFFISCFISLQNYKITLYSLD